MTRERSTSTDPVAAYGEIGAQVSFDPAQRVDRQLERAGFAPSDVTHVVVSHVHFDHTGGLRLFPQARFLLGEGDRGALACWSACPAGPCCSPATPRTCTARSSTRLRWARTPIRRPRSARCTGSATWPTGSAPGCGSRTTRTTGRASARRGEISA